MLGNKTAVLIDEFDFTGSFFAAETEHTVAEKDNTVFGADAMTFEPGLASDKLMLRGYYSGNAAGAVFKELRARLGAAGRDTCMAILIDTTDPNEIAECDADAWGKALKVNLAAPELVTFELNTADAGDMASGLVLWRGTATATGAKSAVNFGAAGTAGGRVFVFVRAAEGLTGTASITVTTSPSGNADTFVSACNITFGAVGGYYAATSLQALGPYMRVQVGNLGNATSITLTVIACVKGVTY
jgi:hypothetical protein